MSPVVSTPATNQMTQSPNLAPVGQQPQQGTYNNTDPNTFQAAYLNSNGTPNLNYVPTDKNDPAFLKVDPYTANILSANYLKSQGVNVDSTNMPTSQQDDISKQLDLEKQNTTQLDAQIDESKRKAAAQFTGTQGALTNQFAQNREGVQSAGDVMVGQNALSSGQTAYNALTSQLNFQQQQLKVAQQQGDQKLVQQLTDQVTQTQQKAQQLGIQQAQAANQTLSLLNSSGALANLSPQDQQFIQQGMPGVPQGVVQALSNAATRTVGQQSQAFQTTQQQAEIQKQTTTLNNVKGIAEMGVAITPQMAMQFAQQTGLPTNSFLNYNTAVQQIQQDKTLSNTQKQQQIQEAGYKLDQEQNGIFTSQQQNIDYLTKMYASGAKPDMISAFKNAIGVTDQNDPKVQADNALAQANAVIAQKKAAGIPITAEDQLNEAKASEALSYFKGGVGGSDVAYVPKNPKLGIQISVQNGKYTVTPPPNTEFQCGAFVNRCWGQQVFGSLGSQKMAEVDKDGFPTKGTSSEELANKVKPGMAFVMPIANNIYDHVGLVQSVSANGITTIEANANGRATTNSVGPGASNVTSGRFIPWSQLYGFVPPPDGSTQQVGKSADDYKSYLQEAKDKGLPFDAAQKYATEKTTAALNNPTDTGEKVTPTYAQYGLLANTDFNPGNSTDKAAGMYLDSYIKNGALPSARALGIGTGKDSSGKFSDAAARANDLYFAATGQSLPDVQTLKANKDLIVTNNKLLNNLSQQENTVGANFKLSIDNLDKNGLNQNSQPINAWLNNMMKLAGDPATAGYLAQNATLGTEMSQLLAAKSTGGATVGDKLEAAGLIDKDASEDQQKEVLKKLMAEAENSQKSIKDSNSDLYKKIDPLERLPENPNRKATSASNNPAGGVGSFIQAAAQQNAHPTDILAHLKQQDPQYAKFIDAALLKGASPQDIISHFSKQ